MNKHLLRYKYSVGLLFIIGLTINTYAQTPYTILSDTAFKYFVGSVEPNEAWNTLAYNDSSWTTGYHSIGFGDNDDATIIDTTISCYLRIPFVVNQKN